jgi:hypothetical protein
MHIFMRENGVLHLATSPKVSELIIAPSLIFHATYDIAPNFFPTPFTPPLHITLHASFSYPLSRFPKSLIVKVYT